MRIWVRLALWTIVLVFRKAHLSISFAAVLLCSFSSNVCIALRYEKQNVTVYTRYAEAYVALLHKISNIAVYTLYENSSIVGGQFSVLETKCY